MWTVTAEPRTALLDAVNTILQEDATLLALATGGVLGQLSQASRTTPPYLVFGRTSVDRNVGAMVPGARVTIALDGWSAAKGAYEMERILSRVSVLLERRPRLAVPGFVYIVGSLTCELSDVDWEPDLDSPDRGLWRGMQRWQAEIHES